MAIKPVILCILDGWGIGNNNKANAPYLAATPNIDKLMRIFPHAQLMAHGSAVGLPPQQMGNSEVGHTNIGAGRIIKMDLCYIDQSIASGEFQKKPALQRFILRLKETGGTAHLLGIISDGGVHCHIAHIITAANHIAQSGVPVALHLATDGRDVAPISAIAYIKELTYKITKNVKIATLCGRLFAYDRDNRWLRVKRAYDLIIKAEGIIFDHKNPEAALRQQYSEGKKDEFIPPLCADDYTGTTPNDGVFCLNFRPDRARQILSALLDPQFNAFDRAEKVTNFATALGMISYSDEHNCFIQALFQHQKISNTLAEQISKANKIQFHIAETEKYPHVTFFFNGGYETPFAGENREMPPSPKVKTYDLAPEMSAKAVSCGVIDAINSGYDFILVNFANPDMVGHTGSLSATIRACEEVDKHVGQIFDALKTVGGMMLVTADHGNAEKMIDPATNTPHTAHTINPVPIILVNGPKNKALNNGKLADIAPTILELMKIAPPPEMTGKSLLFNRK